MIGCRPGLVPAAHVLDVIFRGHTVLLLFFVMIMCPLTMNILQVSTPLLMDGSRPTWKHSKYCCIVSITQCDLLPTTTLGQGHVCICVYPVLCAGLLQQQSSTAAPPTAAWRHLVYACLLRHHTADAVEADLKYGRRAGVVARCSAEMEKGC